MPMRYTISLLLLLLPFFFPSSADAQPYPNNNNKPSDTDALTIFRTLADAHANLASNWTTPDACTGRWLGVGCTNSRRVVSLSLPSLDLRGPLDPLSRLRRLRRLDLHDNRLNGTLHALLPSLPNLKLLYLSHNDISGHIPAISSTRLLRLDLSDNNLQGPIPTETFSALTRLLTLRLDNNLLSGPLPDLSNALPNLTLFNVSNNQLSGPVPEGVRAKFGLQCLSGNAGLCGPTPPLPLCSPSSSSPPPKLVPSHPSTMPAASNSSSTANNASTISVDGGGDDEEKGSTSTSTGRNAVRRREIVGISVGNAVLLLLLLSLLLAYCCCCCNGQRQHLGGKEVAVAVGKGAQVEDHDDDDDDDHNAGRSSGDSYSQLEKGKKKKAGGRMSSDEGEEAQMSKLVFFEQGDELSDGSNSDGSGGRRQRIRRFGLDELLRASAEMVGKGSVGTVYRAVLEDGRTVAVKRLRDSNPCPRNDFHDYMNLIGRLSHPNLVPLRAYCYAKQEKLLVYDYLPNATLYTLLHGNRGAGRSRIPVGWTTRVGLVLGAARGLAHIHHHYRSSKIPHGNVKSANVLLDEDGAARVADFGLALLLNPAHAVARLGGYKAPEQHNLATLLSQEADVYGFGVLLLEVLTGRAPAQHPSTTPAVKGKGGGEDGLNLPEWVRSVVREEWTAEVFDAELMRYESIEEEMVAMLHVALACVAPPPDRRPTMNQVVKMIEDITAAPEQSPPLPQPDEDDLDDSRVSLSPSISTEDGHLSSH